MGLFSSAKAFAKKCVHVACKPITGILTGVGSISDAAQTNLGLMQFFKAIFPAAAYPKAHLISKIVAGIVSLFRLPQSVAMEAPYTFEALEDFSREEKKEIEVSKVSCSSYSLKKIALTGFSWIVNALGSSSAALSTIAGFAEVVPAWFLGFIYFVAGVDGLQTLFTEGSFFSKILECQKDFSEEEEKHPLGSYEPRSFGSRAIWWATFIVLGSLNALIEAGFSLVATTEFFNHFKLEINSGVKAYQMMAASARGLQNLALDGQCVSNFFAKRWEGFNSDPQRTSCGPKIIATGVGIPCALMQAIVGFVGMSPVASALTNNPYVWFTLCALAAGSRVMQNVLIESRQLYYESSQLFSSGSDEGERLLINGPASGG